MWLSNLVRKAVSNGRATTVHEGHVLDVSYISPRLLGMSFPSEGWTTVWRNDVRVVRDFLTARHRSRWHVWNLTEHAYSPALFYGAVSHAPIPDHHAPGLMQALDIVQAVQQWLSEDPDNVACIHCLAGKGRTGTICAMVLVAQGYAAMDALALFAAGRGQAVSQPSQIRFVTYFEKLLLMENRRPTPPLLLLRLAELSRVPNLDGDGARPECIVEAGGAGPRLKRAASSPPRVATGGRAEFQLSIPVRGDVCIRVLHQGVPLFRLQVHTLFLQAEVERGVAEFGLRDLDEQNEQPGVFERRFDPACKFRLFFELIAEEELVVEAGGNGSSSRSINSSNKNNNNNNA